MPKADYPAAHSMDSGWFAVDENGEIAYFDTDEAGAMPTNANLKNSEAGVERRDFWTEYLYPWAARNLTFVKADVGEDEDVFALFESADSATHFANEHQLKVEPQNKSLVMLDQTLIDLAEQSRGLVGLSRDYEYLVSEEEEIPIYVYDHDNRSIPGDYVRHRQRTNPPFRIQDHDQLEKMNLSFESTTSINLADHYSNEECFSWSERDLRTGEPIAQQRSQQNSEQKSTKILALSIIIVFALMLWFIFR